jgi:hypothetical protein
VIQLINTRKQFQAKGKAAVKQLTLAVGIVSAILFSGIVAVCQENGSNKIYDDQSHCLLDFERRSDNDIPISCYCKNAIAEARYVHYTYVLSGKDPNLTGVALSLMDRAGEACGKNGMDYHIWTLIHDANWKWDGPEVVRTYPPDEVMRQLKPNGDGMIPIHYTVVLLQRDSQGHVTKTENYAAVEMWPAGILKFLGKHGPSKTPPTH